MFGNGEKIKGQQKGNGTAYGSVTEVLLGNREWVLVLLIKAIFKNWAQNEVLRTTSWEF